MVAGLFRVDETLTTATLVLTITGNEGLHDLILGPSTSGIGDYVYFTIHDNDSGGEEVWEVTATFCDCDPNIQKCTIEITPIPTLNQWGLIAMAGLLGLFSLFIIVRCYKFNLN